MTYQTHTLCWMIWVRWMLSNTLCIYVHTILLWVTIWPTLGSGPLLYLEAIQLPNLCEVGSIFEQLDRGIYVLTLESCWWFRLKIWSGDGWWWRVFTCFPKALMVPNMVMPPTPPSLFSRLPWNLLCFLPSQSCPLSASHFAFHPQLITCGHGTRLTHYTPDHFIVIRSTWQLWWGRSPSVLKLYGMSLSMPFSFI